MLVHVSNLEPDVRVGEGIWGTLKDLLETAETFLIFAALLIDYAQSKEDFVRLVEVQIYKGRIRAGTFTLEKTYIPLFIRRTEAKASSA